MSATVITLKPSSVRAAAAGGRRPAPQGQVRLTRRGRLVVLALALLVVLAVGVALGGGSAATDEPGAEVATEIVVVDHGDTLWGIASDYAEHGGQVRSVMAEIERINRLDSPALMVGQRLHVPLEG